MRIKSDASSREFPINFVADRWFVYLFPTVDCSVFKIGFSSNPLQRLYSFNRRYFERIDVRESLSLRVESEIRARALESELKKTFADFRAEPPSWVNALAGGQTEWFSAIHFTRAKELLNSLSPADDASQLIDTFDHLFNQLRQFASSFEFWAVSQARLLQDNFVSTSLGYEPIATATSLRDWLDAYRFFAIPLFIDDPNTFRFVDESARLFN